MTKRSRKSRNPEQGKTRRSNGSSNGLRDVFTRQRLTVGGMTAFAVAFSYVSANALWYQPHVHSGAFFATRTAPEPVPGQSGDDQSDQSTASVGSDEPPEGDTVIRLEQEQPIPPRRPSSQDRQAAAQPTAGELDRVSERQVPSPDRMADLTEEGRVRVVQTMLTELNLYDDEIDGLHGPNTRQAIEAYQEMVGLAVTGTIDDELLEELGRADLLAQDVEEAGNDAVARNGDDERQLAQAELQRQTDSIETASSSQPPSEGLERRIRAGLKAFGNDGVSIDGPMDERTRAAIEEFQSLFGLETDGRPSEEVYAKMQEIGLIN